MSTTVYIPSRVSEAFWHLSEPQRYQLQESFDYVSRWMERGAPPQFWRDARPAIEIVVNSFLRLPSIKGELLARLVLMKYEMLQPSPDFEFMRYLWRSIS